MQDNQRIIDALREVAVRLTPNSLARNELLQEIAAHLVRLRHRVPGRPDEWYLSACELHARVWLRRWRHAQRRAAAGAATTEAVGANGADDPLGVLDKVIAHGLEQNVRRRLTPRQAEILDHVLAGHGLREIGRQLGVSHVAVIKLRNKVARTGRQLLLEAATSAPEPGPDEPNRQA
ncbi:hypothetical protein HQ590_08855 [bacterium]|nr:hypothetical protein [bacterium]